MMATTKGTPVIGIVSSVHPKGYDFAMAMVDYGTDVKKFTKDQDYPRFIDINLPLEKNFEGYLINCIRMAYEAGADVIALPIGYSADYCRELQTRAQIDIPVIANEKFPELAKHVMDYVSDSSSLKKKSRNAKENRKVKHYAVIDQNIGIVGLLGGGGVRASTENAQKLGEKMTPYIHDCVSDTPDKNNAAMGIGDSFIEDYKEEYSLLKSMGVKRIGIPCNTAHAFLENYIPNPKEEVLDIRTACLQEALSKFRGQNYFILLATNGSIKKGIYDNYAVNGRITTVIETNTLPNTEGNTLYLIIPSEEERQMIMKSIYDVKEGLHLKETSLMDESSPRNLILKVVDNLRKRLGKKIPVLLACTELHLPFTLGELHELGLISSSHALANKGAEFSKEYALNARRGQLPYYDSPDEHSGDENNEKKEPSKKRTTSELIGKYKIQASYGIGNSKDRSDKISVIRLYISAPDQYGTAKMRDALDQLQTDEIIKPHLLRKHYRDGWYLTLVENESTKAWLKQHKVPETRHEPYKSMI